MIKKAKEYTVVLSRIEGFSSSILKDPEMAEAMRAREKKIIEKFASEFDCKVLKDQKDHFCCLFNNPVDAVRYSVKIQKIFLDYPKIPIKLALVLGKVKISKDKVSGKIINIAQKIAESSKAGSVIVTAKVNQQIQNIKGIYSEFLEVYEWGRDMDDIQLFVITDEELIVPQPEEIQAHIKPIDAINTKKKSNLKHIFITIGTLIFASAIFAYLNVLSTEPVIDNYSIVVLPFNDLGNDEQSRLTSEAITKDILNNLSLLEDLYVISSYSTMKYNGLNKDNKEIAKELGVAFILRGSSHKFGNKIRITTELIDIKANKVIWKNSYSDDYNNIMVIESEISKEVVDALRLKLSFDDMQNVVGIPTGNIEAYQFFVEARHEADQKTALGNKNSIDLYSKAIRIDTAYAEAYTEIARATVNKVKYNNADPQDIEKLAELYLERAESINDQLAGIYTVRGRIFNLLEDFEKASIALNKAIELAPNDVATKLELAEYYRITNQPKKQMLQNKLAYQLDPLNFDTANAYVSALILNKNFDEAEKLINKLNELLTDIDPVEMDRQRAKLYLAKKDYKQALLPLIRVSDLDSTYLGSLGYNYVKLGDTLNAYTVMDTIKSLPEHTYKGYNIAKIFNALRLKDSVYKYLDSTGLRQRLVKDSIFHFFDNLKKDRRYKRLIAPHLNTEVRQPL